MEIKNLTEMLALCILIVVFVHFVGSLAGLLVEFPPPQNILKSDVFLLSSQFSFLVELFP